MEQREKEESIWYEVSAAASLSSSRSSRDVYKRQLLRQGITEDELKGWFAVCEKIRSNLEQYQCNMCREGQK